MRLRLLMVLLGALLFGASATGCATSRRVTALHWYDETTLFVAYSEAQGADSVAKVKRCTIAADNAVSCAEVEQVNRLLSR